MQINLPHVCLKYKHVQVMEALGGVLDPEDAASALMAHRFSKGERYFLGHLKKFRGKAPVSLKLKAYAAAPRAVALFLQSHATRGNSMGTENIEAGAQAAQKTG